MSAIAVYDKSPEQVYAWLKSMNSNAAVEYLPAKHRIDPEATYKKIIFIVGAADFSANTVAVRNMPKHTFYVFGHKDILKEYGLKAGDFREKEPVRPRAVPLTTITKRLIKASIKGTLFYPLMTFLYTLPSKTHQKPLTHAVCQWLMDGGTLPNLETNLNKLGLKMKPKDLEQFFIIMQLPVVERIQTAFKELRSGKCLNDGQAVIFHNVQAFELGFVRGTLQRAQNLTDTYAANQGLK